jgi:CubicO group peptidase (beta-lactamase class C family)
VTKLEPEVDPAEAGFDAGRLARIDRHFSRYVDDGRLPGWLLTVSRHGRLVHVASCGNRDMEAGLPVEPDTLWRIYSMTKPITTVAAMMLYEEGRFLLTDPVSAFVPAFADMRVYVDGPELRPVTVPAVEPIRIWHLLTHTAGLTYGFHRRHPTDAIYRGAGFEWSVPPAFDAERCCDAWAGMPLMFQPGSSWNYSVATDVLGRVVEVVSGQSLDEFLADRILRPLGMTDTGFGVAEPDRARLAALYGAGAARKAIRLDALAGVSKSRPRFVSGGGGLISTAADYHRFTQLLLSRPDSPAGELDGMRLLSPRTVSYMTRNHLPGGADLESFGHRAMAEAPAFGVGFGLGVAVVIDPVAGRTYCTEGEYSWGGAASTAFWVDQAEQLTVSFYTQLLPPSTHPIRPQLRQMVYQALVD